MASRDPPVIIALDFASAEEALRCAQQLSGKRCRLKVGKELFTAAGPPFVERLMALGFEVFLDLKFHDIPSTTAAACRAAASLGVWMINVHAAGGSRMIEAAANELSRLPGAPLLTAVTVLTSMDDVQLHEVGVDAQMGEQVVRLAGLAARCGCDGIVCSARDLQALRGEVPGDFLFVTPGIRPSGTAADDQRRVMTPAEAVRAGATHLVVGRPVTRADDPGRLLTTINEEIADIA